MEGGTKCLGSGHMDIASEPAPLLVWPQLVIESGSYWRWLLWQDSYSIACYSTGARWCGGRILSPGLSGSKSCLGRGVAVGPNTSRKKQKRRRTGVEPETRSRRIDEGPS